jgi:hypothetical protein
MLLNVSSGFLPFQDTYSVITSFFQFFNGGKISPPVSSYESKLASTAVLNFPPCLKNLTLKGTIDQMIPSFSSNVLGGSHNLALFSIRNVTVTVTVTVDFILAPPRWYTTREIATDLRETTKLDPSPL